MIYPHKTTGEAAPEKALLPLLRNCGVMAAAQKLDSRLTLYYIQVQVA
jgi:hypothetical protein